MDRKVQISLLVIAAILLFAGGYRYALFRASTPEEIQIVGEELEEAEAPVETIIGVHVAGAVNKPGVYQLASGARVEDAVNKALPSGDAALNYLNLARKVVDGERIYVPREEELENSGEGLGVPIAAGFVDGGKININTASNTELETLPGIGPTLAQRIIDHRSANGHFQTLEDIKKVSGIGSGRFEQIKDQISI